MCPACCCRHGDRGLGMEQGEEKTQIKRGFLISPSAKLLFTTVQKTSDDKPAVFHAWVEPKD